MRTTLFSIVFIALLALACPPASATDSESGTQPQAAAPTDTQTADATNDSVGEQQEYTCPSCGRTFTVGRHGEETGPVKCPYCGAECAMEKALCFGADSAFLSKYVSRGLVTTNGWVLEPYLWASYRGVTLSAWGNMDLTDRYRLSGEFNEFDLAIDYSNSIGPLGYSAGAIYYTYPNTITHDTAEFYAGLSYDILLKPRLVVYYDFWDVDGFYCAFSISHSFGMPEVIKDIKSSLDLSAQAGLGSRNFNEYNFGDSHTAFIDCVLTASLPVLVTDYLTIRPTVIYSTVLDRTIRTKNVQNDNIIFGAVVSASY